MILMTSPFADIHFDFDKSMIKDGDKPNLQKIANYLKQHPRVKVRIEGNCDERGTSEYNMALGERRAESARKYLIGLGIPAKEISTMSSERRSRWILVTRKWRGQKTAVIISIQCDDRLGAPNYPEAPQAE